MFVCRSFCCSVVEFVRSVSSARSLGLFDVLFNYCRVNLCCELKGTISYNSKAEKGSNLKVKFIL